MMGFIALSEEEEKERKRFFPLHVMEERLCKDSEKAAFCKPGRWLLPEPDHTGTLI